MSEVERRRNMTERILVFRGDRVVYNYSLKVIVCVSKDDCFTIDDVDPSHIRGESVEIFFTLADTPIIEGNELWSDGGKWIIKG